MIQLLDAERLHRMIVAHELQFGKKPDVLDIPRPEGIVFEGVKINFHLGPQWFSCDREHVLHHYFEERPK